MSAFTFDEYRLVAASEELREHLQKWIDADPFHSGKVGADFFIKQQTGSNSCVLLDKFGEPVFYFKTELALRVHIQFGPAETTADRERNREALTKGFAWLKQMAANLKVRQLIFGSENPLLIHFSKKRLGFHKSPFELVCPVTPTEPQTAQEKA